MRVLIAGGPKTGKTTLAAPLGLPVFATDSLIGRVPWGQDSEAVVDWMYSPGSWVIEGVTVVRAARKWLELEPDAPCDRMYFLSESFEPLTPKQQSMAAGIRTIWRKIRGELLDRGVDIIEGLPGGQVSGSTEPARFS